MKASFVFELPEECEEFKAYCQAPDTRDALWAFYQWLRSERKHRDPPPDIDEIWDTFHEIFSSRGVEI